MSDPKPTKKPGGKKPLIMLIVIALVMGGGGIAAGAYAASAGLFGGAPKAKHKAHEEEAEPEGEAHYYKIDQGFTANLRGSATYVQASIAVSSRGKDEKVVDAVKANEPAMRSIILQTLTDQTAESIGDRVGRKKLLTDLRIALNAELREKVGFGGIDNVYFTAFVMQ